MINFKLMDKIRLGGEVYKGLIGSDSKTGEFRIYPIKIENNKIEKFAELELREIKRQSDNTIVVFETTNKKYTKVFSVRNLLSYKNVHFEQLKDGSIQLIK